MIHRTFRATLTVLSLAPSPAFGRSIPQSRCSLREIPSPCCSVTGERSHECVLEEHDRFVALGLAPRCHHYGRSRGTYGYHSSASVCGHWCFTHADRWDSDRSSSGCGQAFESYGGSRADKRARHDGLGRCGGQLEKLHGEDSQGCQHRSTYDG